MVSLWLSYSFCEMVFISVWSQAFHLLSPWAFPVWLLVGGTYIGKCPTYWVTVSLFKIPQICKQLEMKHNHPSSDPLSRNVALTGFSYYYTWYILPFWLAGQPCRMFLPPGGKLRHFQVWSILSEQAFPCFFLFELREFAHTLLDLTDFVICQLYRLSPSSHIPEMFSFQLE